MSISKMLTVCNMYYLPGVSVIGSDPAVSVAASQRVRGGVDWPEQVTLRPHGARPAHVGPHGRGHRHLLRGELCLAWQASVTIEGWAVRSGWRSRGWS